VSLDARSPDDLALEIEFHDASGEPHGGATHDDWDSLVEASVRVLSERHGIGIQHDAGESSRRVRLRLAPAPDGE
jgi:hypothetical protein